jgi:hypothetical protein
MITVVVGVLVITGMPVLFRRRDSVAVQVLWYLQEIHMQCPMP